MTTWRALVLGGHGDIGTAIGSRLSADGLEVVSVGRSDFDLADGAAIDSFFSMRGGEFDVLVHSGGANHPAMFENLTEREIKQSLEVNLHGFLRVARLCLPYWKIKRTGRVVIVSSLYGFLARRGRLPYVMSKHALIGAMKTLAIEWASLGILVNAVSPGYIATKMTYKNNSSDTIDRLTSGIPAGRLGTPDDIAEVVAFLASPRNRYLTGQDLVVDGGYSAGGFQQ